MNRIIRCALLSTVLFSPVTLPIVTSRADEVNNLKINAFSKVTYDSNITQLNSNELSDWYNRTGVEGTFVIDHDVRKFELSALLQQEIYANEDQFNFFASKFKADFEQEFSRLDRLHALASFEQSESVERADELLGRNNGRYQFNRGVLALDYTRDLDSQTKIKTGYRFTDYTTKRDDIGDSNTHTFNLGFAYAINSESNTGLMYKYSLRDQDPGTTADTHSFLYDYDRMLNNLVKLKLGAGLDYVDVFNRGSTTKPRFSAELVRQENELTQYSVKLEQLSETNDYQSDVFTQWRATLAWGQEWDRRLKSSTALFYGQGEYDSLNIDEEVLGMDLGANYELKTDLFLDANYSLRSKMSNSSSREFDRQQITLGFRLNL